MSGVVVSFMIIYLIVALIVANRTRASKEWYLVASLQWTSLFTGISSLLLQTYKALS